MSLFRYFKYYYKLTEGRITTFLLLSLIAVGCQGFALGVFAAVLQFTEVKSRNIFVDTLFSVLEYFSITERNTQFTWLMATTLIFFCISCLLFILTVYYTSVVQSDIYVKMQKRFVNKLLDCDYQFYMTNNVGFLNNVITMQIRQTSQSFKFYTTIISNTLLAAVYLIAPFLANAKMVVILGLAALPLVGILYYINRKTRQYSIESVSEQSRLNGILFQLVSHFKYLKSTETYTAVLKKHIQFSETMARLMRRLALLGAVNEHGLLAFAVSFSIIMVAWMFLIMKVPIFESVAVLGLLFLAARRLSTIPSAYQKFLSVSGAILVCQKLEEELDQNREKITSHGTEHPDFSERIMFEDVSFGYTNNEGKVLNHINLCIEPRSSVAFVGGSGAGKSTIVNLITGLLSPTEGKITLGGIDYQDLNIRELRSGIGYVTQEPVVFNDTVRNNISLWQEELSEKDVIDATRKAHADDFINEFSDRYDTLLGDNGLNISGGQRQRITIARELLRNTHVLILDEATNQLDTKTERLVQQSIEECRGEKTLIIIAHRLSTIKNCDKVLVLENGSLVESGTYEELYNQNGRFRSMVNVQTVN